MRESGRSGEGRGVDLDAVSRLVQELGRDLEKVRRGAGDIDALRDEVAALGDALKTGEADHQGISQRLKAIHGAMDELKEDAFIAADYATRIARMLGL